MLPIIRPIRVFLALLPFVLSFLRDWQGWILFGDPRLLNEEQHRDRARRLTRTLASLGPAFIKGAQVLGTREDLLPKTYTAELKTLQDRVPPFPASEALRIIRECTGRDALAIFESFDESPIAAASLGQVHKAVYRGRPVAVKLLRPGVERIVEIDLLVVTFLIRLFHVFIDNYVIRNFWDIMQEYQRMIRQEMDFRNEELHADRFRRNFAADPRVVIPDCHPELTSPRMVVFDFVEGVRVDDPAALATCGLTPEVLIARLIEIYVRMTIIHGFIHADPHPGNLFVDRQGRVVILDYGMALDFPDATRVELLRGCMAVVGRDTDTLVDAFYRLDMVEPDINRALVRDAAETLLTIQFRRDFTPRMIQDIADDILATFHRFPVRMPQQLVYLFRASALIEGLGMQYDPHFSGVREATPVIKRLIRDVALGSDKALKERVVDIARETWDTVRHLKTIIERFEREEQRVRLHPADLQGLQDFLAGMTRRLLLGMGALSAIVGGVVVAVRGGSWLLAGALVVPGALALLLFLVLPMSPRRPLR